MGKQRSLATLPLDGGTLAFHFINTVYAWRKENLHEYLTGYSDILTWCTKVKALSANFIRDLRKKSLSHPSAAENAYRHFLESRHILYKFFSAVAGNEPNTQRVSFNRLLTQSIIHYGWVEKNEHYEYSLLGTTDLLLPLWAIMQDAHRVMAENSNNGRIKECGHCGWIFLDTTRNGQRRWCNPATCGSVEKLKKYYEKNKTLNK